ncbi:hypothetical protein QIW53_14015, partial [Pseudomonas fluorescens]|uniref:hypothetical protein n=1 Tax=Pseudomonas fluorescens TaxID=294 RepID=UPI003525E1DE
HHLGSIGSASASSMARTIRSVFLTVNPLNSKNLKNVTSGIQISFAVSIKGFGRAVAARNFPFHCAYAKLTRI